MTTDYNADMVNELLSAIKRFEIIAETMHVFPPQQGELITLQDLIATCMHTLINTRQMALDAVDTLQFEIEAKQRLIDKQKADNQEMYKHRYVRDLDKANEALGYIKGILMICNMDDTRKGWIHRDRTAFMRSIKAMANELDIIIQSADFHKRSLDEFGF